MNWQKKEKKMGKLVIENIVNTTEQFMDGWLYSKEAPNIKAHFKVLSVLVIEILNNFMETISK